MNPHLFGHAEDRTLNEVSFKYGRTILVSRHFAWQYTGSVTPLILMREPTFALLQCPLPGPGGVVDPVLCVRSPREPSPILKPFRFPPPLDGLNAKVNGHRTNYAFGLEPIGMKFNFLPRRKVQPLLDSSAGMIFFANEPFVPGSSKKNFSVSVGTGVQWFYKRDRSISFEYQFRHISNGGLTPVNYGLDTSSIRISYSFHR
jgi:hypothetical protein